MTEHIQREKETLKHQFHVGLMMHSSAERSRIRPTDRPTVAAGHGEEDVPGEAITAVSAHTTALRSLKK